MEVRQCFESSWSNGWQLAEGQRERGSGELLLFVGSGKDCHEWRGEGTAAMRERGRETGPPLAQHSGGKRGHSQRRCGCGCFRVMASCTHTPGPLGCVNDWLTATPNHSSQARKISSKHALGHSIPTNTHTHMHTCIHVHTHTCMHTCMHTCIHTHTQQAWRV